MEMGNYLLTRPTSYHITFCDSDCVRCMCQRNKESLTRKYFEEHDRIKYKEDLSDVCVKYLSPLEVEDYDAI